MIEAAKTGDIRSLRKQIRQGRAPDLKDGNGMTALHYAVKNGHLNCVNYLLRSCMDEYNLTRIEASKAYTHVGTPIILACRENNVSMDIIKALIKADPESIHMCMSAGGNALHVACRSERADLVQLLLDTGADVDARSNTGLRPLHTAAQSNDLSCLRILLEAGADTSLCNLSGCTPLFSTILDEYISSADLLLDYMYPEGINITTKVGYSVLMKVAEYEYKHLVKKLLLKGADPYIQNYEGRFAVDFTKCYDCARLILKAMDRNRLRNVGTRDFPYKTVPKKIVKLMCSSIPELFALQAIEYVHYHWEKDQDHCVQIIRLLLSKLPIKIRRNKVALKSNCTKMEAIDTYLSLCKQDIVLYWRDTNIISKPYASPIKLDKFININVELLCLLAAINPRYSPSFIVNREIDTNDVFRHEMKILDIPQSWELEYNSNGEFTKTVQSLKHLARCSLRQTFCDNGLLSYKDFQNGLEELGLPKSVHLYIRYLD